MKFDFRLHWKASSWDQRVVATSKAFGSSLISASHKQILVLIADGSRRRFGSDT